MKKFILFTLLVLGLGLSSQAQSLDYKVYNSSSDSWKLKMVDAGTMAPTSEFLAPSTYASGTIAGFALPLKWVVSSTAGCIGGVSLTAPTGTTAAFFTDTCGNSHAYAVIEVSPGNYLMKLMLN